LKTSGERLPGSPRIALGSPRMSATGEDEDDDDMDLPQKMKDDRE
jgi:hypothetical protein